MQLKAYRHLWGVPRIDEGTIGAIRSAGYQGIEYKAVRVAEHKDLPRLLQEYKLEYIAQVHTEGHSVGQHFESFQRLVDLSLRFDPVLINSQSGADRWTWDEKRAFTEKVLTYEAQLGVPVVHETHRGRITYNPWDTQRLLQTFPALKLCGDFSHWVTVCERLLNTEEDIIALCARHCHHLHTRVGYEQGPQVPDPRAPEYARHLDAHRHWWQLVWQAQREKGFTQSRFTPEFGPPLYHHTLPYTQAPVSDVAEISEWMHGYIKNQFAQQK